MSSTKKRKNEKASYGGLGSFYTFGLRQESVFFLENLSILLGAGMSITEALRATKEEVDSRRMRRIIKLIEKDVRDGVSLAHALEKARILSSHTLALIRLGEMSGKLNENLKVIVIQNEKEATLRSRVRSSLMYAIIIFSLTLIIGPGTAWFTLPRIVSFFNDINAELPLITRWLIYAGHILGEYGFIIIPVFLLIILSSFYFLFSFPRTKFVGHLLLFRIPLIKKLIKQVEIARFGFLLGIMIESGISATNALAAMPGTTTFQNYRKFYVHLKNRVEEGNSLHKSFDTYPRAKKLFPPSVRQMINAAERSGSLSDVLLRIGTMYESKTENTARNLPIVLEPILLLIIGAGVAFLAVGIILPIYNLSSVM